MVYMYIIEDSEFVE